MHGRLFVIVCGILLQPFLFSFATAQDIFRDQVAPILERRCYSCHNDEMREGDYSMQSRSQTFDDGFIDIDDPDNSYWLELITPEDDVAAMPKDSEPLTTEEIDVIRQWIQSGAEWPEAAHLEQAKVDDFDWWSFKPLQKPQVPETDSSWCRTPIDAFIVTALEENGLSPSPEADRRTLIRRLTFDLHGLPPTPEETQAFINDISAEAYERLVDRLLASPRYGERWARHWLDVVKYADTCGYDKDKLRPNAWPYRDYVIRSFNDDKPYHRFVQEQIAGDALFPGEADGIIGLGFLAAGPWDFIGHVEVPETKIDGQVARNLDRDDIVCNVINTFCSVTIQCARCHHHKFDPFTQEDYYGLQAVFAAVDRAERPYDLDPVAEARKRELRDELAAWNAEENRIHQQIENEAGESYKKLGDELTELLNRQKISQGDAFGFHSEIVSDANVEKWVELSFRSPVDINLVRLRPCYDDFANIGAGFGFPKQFRVEVGDDTKGEIEWTTIANYTSGDVANPGVVPFDIQCDEQNVSRIRMTASKLAERSGDFHFALAEVQVYGDDPHSSNLAREAEVQSSDSIEAAPRWGVANLNDDEFPVASDDSLQIQIQTVRKRIEEIRSRVETVDRRARMAELEALIGKTKNELNEMPLGKMVYAASTDFPTNGSFHPTMGTPRAIHLLQRGEVTNPGELISPRVLPLTSGAVTSMPNHLNESQCRAELAKWATSTDNPLVWRSIVNRIWQYHFGDGLVATPNDFGRMGALPSHPELLDWLAAEFRDSEQSFKALHRLIVTSSVYRQTCAGRPECTERDGSNRFLWRMNRRRLEAEEIRDSILSVSGALDLTMGGPGYYLFELEHPEHSPHYEYQKFDHNDPKSHRRSIYQFVVRSQPNPWMSSLDCADSSQSTPRRNETLTALQALSLLNNQFNLVMAERFADRLNQDARELDEQVRRAVELTLQRDPTEQELNEMTSFAEKHGTESLCRLLFNLSEFVFVD
ncbi:MAG: DUF1549 and DUF1553 domain-containing protein [Pirellulaceae bacterium]